MGMPPLERSKTEARRFTQEMPCHFCNRVPSPEVIAVVYVRLALVG